MAAPVSPSSSVESPWKNLVTFGTVGVGALAIGGTPDMFLVGSRTIVPYIATDAPSGANSPQKAISRSPAVAAQFRRFADEWLGETQNLSDARSVLMHPAYHRILAMGAHVLPYMFDDMAQGNGAHWLPALEAITLGQVNPVPPEHEHDAILMCEDWLDWWRGNEQSA